LAAILADRQLASGASVALLVNGLGGTPPMELAVVARRALAFLRERGLVVARVWSGNLLTALEMPGMSLSVMPVDEARLRRLDTVTTAPAWPGDGRISAARQVVPSPSLTTRSAPRPERSSSDERIKRSALAAAAALEQVEARLTELDAAAGDGDLGISMTRGAAAIRALPEGTWSSEPRIVLAEIANALRRALGGSSGPFYAAALMRAARALPEQPSPQDWSNALTAGTNAVAELGGAKPGDRTMLDALDAAAKGFAAGLAAGKPAAEAWRAAVDAARDATAATAQMYPKLGRASYLGERAVGVPDAGAEAVVIWMDALWPPQQ